MPVRQPAGQVLVDLLALDEVHVQRLVAVLGQQQRAGGLAVAPGAAGLLVVGLERGRHARVHHGAHVGLVHAHAERVGRADHAHVVREEAPLDRRAPLAVEPGVVGHGLLAERLAQLGRQLLRPRARARVDDRRQGVRARAAPRPPAPASRARPAGRPRTRCWAGRSRWPRAAGRAGRAGARRRAPPAAWPWRWRRRAPARRACARRPPGGSSRAGSRGPTARRSAPRPPRTGPRAPRACARGSPSAAKRSGATYSSRSSPVRRALHDRGVRRAVLLGVDERNAVAETARRERLDLVLHQRHQRRDDHREVVAEHPGQLVAERLARAGWHHHEHVAAGQRGLARLALTRAKLAEAEQVAERLVEVHREGHSSGASGGRGAEFAGRLRQSRRSHSRVRCRAAAQAARHPRAPTPAGGGAPDCARSSSRRRRAWRRAPPARRACRAWPAHRPWPAASA